MRAGCLTCPYARLACYAQPPLLHDEARADEYAAGQRQSQPDGVLSGQLLRVISPLHHA